MLGDLLARATETTRLAETVRMMWPASQATRGDVTNLYSLFLRAPRENHLYNLCLEQKKPFLSHQKLRTRVMDSEVEYGNLESWGEGDALSACKILRGSAVRDG